MFNGELWLAFVADNDTNRLLVSHSADGSGWAANTQVGTHSSKSPPSLAVFGNKLWLAYVADNSSNQLMITNSNDGVTWSTLVQLAASPPPSQGRWSASSDAAS